jgi:Mak10 subunit, NatC N(alpha)-terminal acetyltransferase
MGHPLSQTLFTCLYIERLLWPEPKTLEQAQFSRGTVAVSENPWLHRVLRSYCLATIKACHLVRSMITGETYYEVCLIPCLPVRQLCNLTWDCVNRKRTSTLNFIIESCYPEYQPQTYIFY